MPRNVENCPACTGDGYASGYRPHGVCPTCAGQGEMQDCPACACGGLHSDEADNSAAFIAGVCPVCDGRGRVPHFRRGGYVRR